MGNQTPTPIPVLNFVRHIDDHLPLTSLLRVGVSNARVQRWVEFLTAYNYRIIHRKGAAHGNADMLSRVCQPATEADAQGSCSITNPEDHAVHFVGASGMWPRSMPSSAFNVFIETGFARQRLGVVGLLNALDYSYEKSRNQYVYHGHEDVENHVLHNIPSTSHSLCKRVLRQKELPICTVQRYCNSRTLMVAAVVAAQCKPQQSPVLTTTISTQAMTIQSHDRSDGIFREKRALSVD